MTPYLVDIINNCKTFWNTVFNQKGLVKNSDGTISVFVLNSNGIKSPTTVSKQCCDVLSQLKSETYYYDLDTQKCMWSNKTILPCTETKPFKIV